MRQLCGTNCEYNNQSPIQHSHFQTLNFVKQKKFKETKHETFHEGHRTLRQHEVVCEFQALVEVEPIIYQLFNIHKTCKQ